MPKILIGRDGNWIEKIVDDDQYQNLIRSSHPKKLEYKGDFLYDVAVQIVSGSVVYVLSRLVEDILSEEKEK